MSFKESAITKAPKHTDAGQSYIAGCLQIHIAVAHIDGIVAINTQLTESLNDGIWCRLFPDSLSLVLADSHFYAIRKEMLAELTGGSIELIADYSHTLAPFPEFS